MKALTKRQKLMLETANIFLRSERRRITKQIAINTKLLKAGS